MTTKRLKISDTFEQNTCGVCGNCEINQYFSINDNFIEYCGIFYSFREILAMALDLQINHNEAKLMEICLDCKDKVIKFYNFKRKVKEVQNTNVSFSKQKTQQRERKTKIVQNIIEIVENYTERFSISSIRVEETTKKLIIESRAPPAIIEPPFKGQCFEAPAVKVEPEVTLLSTTPYFVDDDSMAGDGDNDSENENHYNQGDSSEPGTSSSTVMKRSQSRNQAADRSDELDNDSHLEKWRLHQEKRRRRMEILKLPDNQDLYEKHKAQARERTRRYRAKLREKKLLDDARKRASTGNLPMRHHLEFPAVQTLHDSLQPFLQYAGAGIKLEEASDDDIIFT